MTTGQRIKELRLQSGMTMEELAAKIGLQKAAIYKYESGIVVNLKRDIIEKLANVFHVSPSYIMCLEDDPATQASASNIIPMPKMRDLPMVGNIACGTPILAEQNIEEFVSAPEHVHADFALRCKGDSMIGARIFDGDIVYIRQQETIENGEIAAVLVDNEATLKRVRLFEDHISLEPENPLYRPLVFWDQDMNNVHILGKAVAFTSAVR